MVRLLLVVAAVALPATVFAQKPAKDYASEVGVTPFVVEGAFGFDTDRGRAVDRVIIGRHTASYGQTARAVLIACGADNKCFKRIYSLGNGQRVVAAKVIDLAGAPTSLRGLLGDRGGKYYRRLNTRTARWPVLVLRTYWTEKDKPRERALTKERARRGGLAPGSGRWVPRRRRSLILLSLRRADFQRALLFRREAVRRGNYGHGQHSTFTLVRGKGRALELNESRQRVLGNGSKCIPPKPTTHRWALTNNRYRERRTKIGMRSGCRH